MDITALNSTLLLRTKVLKWMCLCLAILSAAFTYFNIFINDFIVLGVLEGMFAAYCLAVFICISKTRLQSWQPLSICLCITFLVVLGSYLSAMKHALFVWMLALPVLYYLLLGARWGIILSATLLISEFIALWAKNDILPFATINLTLNLSLSYIAIWVVAHVFENSREDSYTRLHNLAVLDPLTGVGNRLAMNQFFEIELQDKHGLFTMILDLDFFKHVNDKYGHAVGDRVLIAVTELLKSKLTKGKVFRIGGEEFAILAPSSSLTCATNTAQLLCSSLAAHEFIIEGHKISLTVSIGVAKYQPGQTLKQTIKTADEKLYQAKRNGRNQVVIDTTECQTKLESAC
ncbi:GGDEF domain-containing protein [Pseudoalteromonas shioyasakiensis]|uniref:GGDEF domain-containing protein n=1 Tax=Pseudoalteromonas shioyasakiensis TaxID=1190813 RepID=UPI0021176AA3|nr:GGDEF domain-containing protein [Pseudoalteromonas shioyasakiensis]MCQ8878518.1 GGDEF domain-containing protein [Pseudoalteromonas shioyasakiensis]